MDIILMGMSTLSKKFSWACEKLLNELESEYIQEFYGKGTYLRIRDITFSPVKKVCLVDCVVVLGETLNPKSLEDDMTRLLVYETTDKLLRNYSVNVMVSYDV
jgi:hypothetical protein